MLIFCLLGSAGGLGTVMVWLFVACIEIIYATQLIVERSESGDRDVPDHTMMLCFDLLKLFGMIVKVLYELKDKDKKKQTKWIHVAKY